VKRAVVIAGLAALVACSDPPLSLTFMVTQGSEDACLTSALNKASSCSDVEMPCRSVVSIRIFSPDDPTSPYISVCKELTGQPNVCSIAGVDLPQPAIPVNGQTLEVQIAVYPFGKLSSDPNTGDLQCPTGVAFDARGFPVESVQPCMPGDQGDCPPSPAIGGVAFYHPGDDETLVDLGCTDLEQLNDTTCTGLSSIGVNATVDDFDTEVTVQSSLADNLEVAIGEPHPVTDTVTHYQLAPANEKPLTRTSAISVPTWTGSVTEPFMSQCLEVLEDTAGATTSVRCQSYDAPPSAIDATGTRISKDSLAEIVQALGLIEFPSNGLVIGVVLDSLGDPIPNVQVTTSRDDAIDPGGVVYLSADRHSVVTTTTSSNGIFMSQNTPYGTAFHASNMLQSTTSFGGLIDGKVNIVILQFKMQTGM
jgi:hypothetical protein